MDEKQKTVAFISAEYAFDETLPIYAGGLGVLSADFVLEAGHSDLPFVAFGMFYSHGFVTEKKPCLDCDDDDHIYDIASAGFSLVEKNGEKLKLTLTLDDHDITFQAWEKSIGSSKVYLLDCEVPENTEWARRVSAYLYEPDFNIRIMQEGVLGIGSMMLMEALEIDPEIIHLNEGHTGFAGLGILGRIKEHNPEMGIPELVAHAKEHVVSTKHTILPASGLHVPREIFVDVYGKYLETYELNPEEVYELGRHTFLPNTFSGTQLMLSLSARTNAVSKIHAEYERRVHPNSVLFPITNGVYKPRWQCSEVMNAKTDSELWKAHQKKKQALFDRIAELTNISLDTDILTFVWARRITPYKRPDLVFKNLERLVSLVNDTEKPIQIILAGKANATDRDGQATVEAIKGYMQDNRINSRVVYVEEYNLDIAELLVNGADVWLNTPVRGQEASGTSGMKAGLNGVLQCSVSDGWFDEVDWGDLAWTLSAEHTAIDFYDHTSNEIAPLYYENREDGVPTVWVQKMKDMIELTESEFTTHRMLNGYLEKLYKIT